MLSTQGINKLFSNNLNFKTMDVFNTLADATNPNKKPFNRLLDEDKEPDTMEIAKKSHYDNRMSGEYDFLQLNDDNEKTYILGFYAGCLHTTAENIKKLEEEQAPSLNRYAGTGIDNKEAMENIN